MSKRDRHYVGGDRDRPGCDQGEVIAQRVGFREGLRSLATGIEKRVALAATVDVGVLLSLIGPYLEDDKDYKVIPRTDITPFGSVPDHLYHRSASAINDKFGERDGN